MPGVLKGGACGAAGPASAPASGLEEAPADARRALAAGTQIKVAHSSRDPASRQPSTSLLIVQLATAASVRACRTRSATPTIEPPTGSQGFGACEEGRFAKGGTH